MTKLVNCTPHAVVLIKEDVAVLSLAAATLSARVTDLVAKAAEFEVAGGVKVQVNELLISNSKVVDLPPPEPDTLFVVSRVTASAVTRDDLVFPFDEVRGPAGQILGCRQLARFSRFEEAEDAF